MRRGDGEGRGGGARGYLRCTRRKDNVILLSFCYYLNFKYGCVFVEEEDDTDQKRCKSRLVSCGVEILSEKRQILWLEWDPDRHAQIGKQDTDRIIDQGSERQGETSREKECETSINQK